MDDWEFRQGTLWGDPEGPWVAWMLERGYEPLEPFPGLSKPWRSRHLACGLLVMPTVTRLRSGREACVPCRDTANGLRRRMPEEEAVRILLDAGYTPLDPYPGTANSAWKVSHDLCGSEIEVTAAKVRRRNSCLPCGTAERARKRRTPDADAEAEMRAAGYEPLMPFPGVGSAWLARCTRCGNTVSPRLSNVRAGIQCRGCIGAIIHADKAEAEMRAVGLTPLVPYNRANDPWPCTCDNCGRTVNPSLTRIRLGKPPCRYCSTLGHRLTGPSHVYVLTDGESHKVGVALTGSSRLRHHQEHGWNVYRTLFVRDGETAYEIEAAVLRWLRQDLGMPAYHAADTMPQTGWSETVSADAVSLPELWRTVLEASRSIREAHAAWPAEAA